MSRTLLEVLYELNLSRCRQCFRQSECQDTEPNALNNNMNLDVSQ